MKIADEFCPFVLLLMLWIFNKNPIGANSCANKEGAIKIPKGLKEIPVTLVLSTIGKDVRLPCHYCDQEAGINGRIWRKKTLHGKIEEVKLDTHDDEEKNRVFVDTDHTLNIKNVLKEDGAYYFCYDVEKKSGAKMEILLDILDRSTLEPNVLWSPIDLNKALPPLLEECDSLKSIKAISSYKCYVEWGQWSRCDVCGKVGKRRKVGECRLQKLAKASIEAPEGKTIEADFPIVGVGCHSFLLDTVPDARSVLKKIPNIVLMENCEVTCEGYLETATEMTAHKLNAFLKKVKMKSLSDIQGVKHSMSTEVMKEKEGETIALFCPDASLDTPVSWHFENKLLKPEQIKEKTQGRITIDATDTLHIRDLRSTDAGEYICTLYKIQIGLVRLAVVSTHAVFDPTSNFGILTIALLLFFILYLGLLAIKFKSYVLQRKAQKLRLGQRLIRPLVKTSDSDSD